MYDVIVFLQNNEMEDSAVELLPRLTKTDEAKSVIWQSTRFDLADHVCEIVYTKVSKPFFSD